VRVSTAFNLLLQIPKASVADVVIGDRDVEVVLRSRNRLLRCPCGKQVRAVYDRRERRWRHLDLVGRRLWLIYPIRRLDCPDCGVRTEDVPWARPGARHTRDFEDTVLWLTQRTDRTTVATLMRCAWETVTAIIGRGVAELLDERRLQTLYRIGVDEICYRHPHRYLTIVGDHDTGTVVDIQPGRSEQSLANFYGRINAFVALAKRLEVYFEEVIAAIELGISNALIEGINAKIRLINARGYGHHSAQTLASMIYLCLGGLQVKLPTRT